MNQTMSQELINGSVTKETQKKIQAARTLSDRPYEDKMIDYKNFADLFISQAEKCGDKTYLIYRDGDERVELSCKEIFDESSKLADYLYKDLGIRAGDRVSTFAYNHYKTVVVYYAAWLIGAVLVPINISDSDENIKFVQGNSETKVVFVMPDLLERYSEIRKELPAIKHFVEMGDSSNESYLSLSTILKKDFKSDLDFKKLSDLDTEALIVYTSGTTGAPKGVVLEQYNILCNAFSGGSNFGLTDKERPMIVLPIHHVNGLVVTLVTPLYFGASAVLNKKFSSEKFWEIASEEGATCASVVPTILAFLCDAGLENFKKANLPKDFFLKCGAGPLTVDLIMRFIKDFGLKVTHGYGLSETTAFNSFLHINKPEDEYIKLLSHYGYPSIGSAITCNEMSIHTEDGKEVKEEQRGEIVVRGHNVMKYYFKRPEVNEETFKNNWFRTGDEGFYINDSKGVKQFFITGRLKELIIRGGVNYSTFEIDEVLNEIPEVKAAMAVGFENDAYGEEVGAYVMLHEGQSISEEKILEYCKSKLPKTKSPKVIVFGNEFPVTATGKYQRNKLKALFADYKSIQF